MRHAVAGKTISPEIVPTMIASPLAKRASFESRPSTARSPDCPEIMANGGSCAAGPDGEWLLEPVVDKEGVFTVIIDHGRVREERQNFDPSGHYARPDVTKLVVNRERQSILMTKILD